MALSAAQDKLGGGPRVEGHHVDLAGQAALGPAYRLPARFFKAPQASGCTGTDMESSNRAG